MIKRILRQAVHMGVLGTLLFASLLFASSVQARDYQVEVVLFENLDGRGQTADGYYFPKLGNTVQLGTESAVAAGFVPLELNLSLSDDASAIAGSSRYRLIKHLAWRQPGLSRKESIPVRIALGNASQLYIPDDISDFTDFIPATGYENPGSDRRVNTTWVNGSIKVYLGRFLHMETRLVFTDGQSQQGYRLGQSRKMRSRELHYIDNPRFGVLARITPIEDPAETAN